MRLLFLGQDAQLITVVQIQAVHLGFSEEYFEENLEDAFSCIGILGAISFQRILPGRVFPFIQPCPIQQAIVDYRKGLSRQIDALAAQMCIRDSDITRRPAVGRVCGAVGRREPYNLTLENKTYYTQKDDSMR